MGFLKEKDRKALSEELSKLPNPVRFVLFTQELDCNYCPETKALMQEVAALSPTLSVEEHNLRIDREQAERYGVERAPAIAVVGDRDYGIRYYGIPAGYGFTSFLDAIMAVAARDSGLTPQSRAAVAGLTTPVHLRVFSTPT